MDALYLFCAVVGGSVMILQFLLTCIGLGHDGGDLGGGGDVGDMTDVGGAADMGDAGDVGAAGDTDFAGAAADVHDGSTHWTESTEADVGGSTSSRLFGIISFRTVIAALAFFGLAGMAARAADWDVGPSLLVASAAGFAAMYGVYELMRAFYRLRSEGNVHIRGAVGLAGIVYVPIPPRRSGAGKIQINLQNRTMEYEAMTDQQDALPTGARIVVTQVIGPDTLAVRRVPEPADAVEES